MNSFDPIRESPEHKFVLLASIEDLEEEFFLEDDIEILTPDRQKVLNEEIRKAFREVPNNYIIQNQLQDELKEQEKQNKEKLYESITQPKSPGL